MSRVDGINYDICFTEAYRVNDVDVGGQRVVYQCNYTVVRTLLQQ